MWLVRAGSLEDTPGRLSLDDGEIRFTPRDTKEADVRVRTDRIARARRLRGTPVLELTLAGALQETLFLYFVQPPPLGRSGRPEGRSIANPMRGLERAAAGMGLRASGKLLRRQVDEWVRAIRESA